MLWPNYIVIETTLLTIGLLGLVGPRLGVRAGGLAREGLLESPTETGREAVRGGVPKASRHTHRACAKRGYETQREGRAE